MKKIKADRVKLKGQFVSISRKIENKKKFYYYNGIIEDVLDNNKLIIKDRKVGLLILDISSLNLIDKRS